jgi:acetolactate synthase-1/2/3 large subunit
MRAIDAVAEILKREGVDCLFCFPSNPLIDAAARLGIRPIMARSERAVVAMADGYTRASNGRRIGVCTMQCGPGIENSFAGVAQAHADAVPILVLPGHLGLEYMGSTRNFHALPSYRPITKWAAQVNLPERVPDMMRRAFSYLRNGRTGPVLLEIPADVAKREIELNGYRSPGKVRSAGDPAAVRAAIQILLKAERPLLYVGQGVLYAEGTKELQEFAELAGIPVMTTLLGKSAFPENHCLSLGTGGYTATKMVDHFLKSADVVFGIACSFSPDWMAAPVPPGKTVVQITNDDYDLNANVSIDLGILGDAKLVLPQMSEELLRQTGGKARDRAAGVKELEAVKKAYLDEWMPLLTSDEVPINPYRAIWELTRALDPAQTIITHDSGFIRDQMVPFIGATVPRGYLAWGNSTQMGQGIGLALGAKVAAPEKTVVNVIGDTSFGMLGMELETAARSRIAILTILLNNKGMCGMEEQLGAAAERYGLHKVTGDYAKVAEGLGARSERVERPEEIIPAIRRAQQVLATNQPALIEIMTKAETRTPRYW